MTALHRRFRPRRTVALIVLLVAALPAGPATGVRLAGRAPVAQAAALAQDPTAAITVDRWGGATTSVAVAGTRAFVTVGSSVAAVDVADPTAPIELARSAPERDLLTHLHIVADHAVALGYTTGLTVFDVLDPVVPTAVARFGALGPTPDVFFDGAFAYMCDLKGGLRIVDLSDPRAPRLAGEWLPPDGHVTGSVAVADGRAYVLAWTDDGRWEPGWTMQGGRLIVVDVAEPAQPRTLGSLVLDPEGFPSDLAVKDGIVFIGHNNAPPGIVAVDARDPARPIDLGNRDDASAVHIERFGDVLVVDDAMNGNSSLRLWNVGGPDPVAAFDANGSPIYLPRDMAGGVAMEGDRMYYPTGRTLEVLDLGQPFRSPAIGAVRLGIDRLQPSYDLAADGPVVVVAALDAGLRIVDAADPTAPRHASAVRPVPDGSGATPAVKHVALRGRTAYLTETGLGGGLRIVDVTDVETPTVRGAIELPGYAGRPVVMDDYVVVPISIGDEGDYGLRIFDVRNPSAPERVGWFSLPQAAGGVAVAGRTAVVTTDRLIVVDLTDPRAPRRRGQTEPAQISGNVATDGRWAYGLSGQAGLVTFDLSDLDHPLETDRVEGVDGSVDLKLAGDTLFAVGSVGITALDLSQPAEPRVRAKWGRPASQRAVAAANGLLWAIGADSTVHALDPAAPSGPRTLGMLPFEGWIEAAAADGDRVAALTGWSFARPLVTVFGGAPRARLLSRFVTDEVPQPVHFGWMQLQLRSDRLWMTNLGPGLAAFDIADPTAVRRITPDVIGPYSAHEPFQAADLTIEGDRAYASHSGKDGRQRIVILDLARLEAPHVVGGLWLDWQPASWTADGTTIWHDETLSPDDVVTHRIVATDAANPAAPQRVAEIPIPPDPAQFGDYELAADDGVLLVGGMNGIVRAFDVRDLSQPRLIASVDLHGIVFDVAVDDGVAWAGVGMSTHVRVVALDLSDATAPQEIGFVQLADDILSTDLEVGGRTAAVADFRGGLYVLRVPRPGDPPPDATPQLIGAGPGGAATPHPAALPPTARPTEALPPTARTAPIYLPTLSRHVRLAGPPSHLVLALDRSAAMTAPLPGRAPGGAPSARGTRFDAARALAEAVAAAATTSVDGPTVSVVAYDRQAERLAVGAAAATSATDALDVLRRWLEARPPTPAAAARHDVALAAAAADIAAVAPSGCALVALVTAGAASGDAVADRDGTTRAAALRAAGVRTLAVSVDGQAAADRPWLVALVGGRAGVLTLADRGHAADLAATLVAAATGCAR